MAELEHWDSFYVIVGAAAGALIGLQFVVMTLIAENPPKRVAEANPVFATPTIVHFSLCLLVSALMSVPWESAVEAAWACRRPVRKATNTRPSSASARPPWPCSSSAFTTAGTAWSSSAPARPRKKIRLTNKRANNHANNQPNSPFTFAGSQRRYWFGAFTVAPSAAAACQGQRGS